MAACDRLLGGESRGRVSQPFQNWRFHDCFANGVLPRLRGCAAARLRGCAAARLCGCAAARLRGCAAARLRGCEGIVAGMYSKTRPADNPFGIGAASQGPPSCGTINPGRR